MNRTMWIDTAELLAPLELYPDMGIVKHAPPPVEFFCGWTVGRVVDYCVEKNWRFEFVTESDASA
jgi:hypothetical protein